jgi:hypothetical protein
MTGFCIIITSTIKPSFVLLVMLLCYYYSALCLFPAATILKRLPITNSTTPLQERRSSLEVEVEVEVAILGKCPEHPTPHRSGHVFPETLPTHPPRTHGKAHEWPQRTDLSRAAVVV